MTWDLDALSISLGQRYVGKMDELLICDVALDGDDIAQLFEAEDSLRMKLL